MKSPLSAEIPAKLGGFLLISRVLSSDIAKISAKFTIAFGAKNQQLLLLF
jgi:hypothetical protein